MRLFVHLKVKYLDELFKVLLLFRHQWLFLEKVEIL